MEIPSHLLAGYRNFRAGRYSEQADLYRTLAGGQRPRTMVIGCADSRVDPATIFSMGPGELFVVRNVAALVPPNEEGGSYHGTSAAIEFAVAILQVPNIVVLGHGMCGGVAAALSAKTKPQLGRFIGPWVELLAVPRASLVNQVEHGSEELLQKELERLAVKQSIGNLMTFEFVAQAVDEGRLTLDGAWFSIAEGELQWLDRCSGNFVRVSE